MLGKNHFCWVKSIRDICWEFSARNESKIRVNILSCWRGRLPIETFVSKGCIHQRMERIVNLDDSLEHNGEVFELDTQRLLLKNKYTIAVFGLFDNETFGEELLYAISRPIIVNHDDSCSKNLFGPLLSTENSYQTNRGFMKFRIAMITPATTGDFQLFLLHTGRKPLVQQNVTLKVTMKVQSNESSK